MTAARAGLYERCKLALELKRLKTPALSESRYSFSWEEQRREARDVTAEENINKQVHYSVFLFLRRVIYKLLSEVGCGEVTNPK